MSPVGSTTQHVEPFGFKAGMTKAQILEAVGDSVQKDNDDMLIVTNAPKPHPDFEYYLLCVSARSGLSKVRAISKDIDSNSFGTAIQEKFSEIQTALERKYGRATDKSDGLLSGSIWNEPEDWMMGLAKEERVLHAIWQRPGGVGIALIASASSGSEGSVAVEYEFTSLFESWKQEHDEKQDDSF
jgi:hypothetical protein